MKFRLFIFSVLLFVVSTLPVMAQIDNPCGGNGDPDDATTCPLDTWVWVLVIAVTGLAMWQWYQPHKNLKESLNSR